ncbi:MAG: LUD domain-containing protein [Terriglobales bacterium]
MASADNPSRERILGRIRAAVQTTAPHHDGPAGQIFAPVTDPLERFQKECAANITECTVTANTAGSAAAIAKVLASLPPGEIFAQDAPELRALATAFQDGRPLRWSSEGPPNEASQATITLCEALVAQTGSVLVSSANGGRQATVIAPVHIVFARLNQLVPDLEAVFARIYERGIASKNSYVCLITGSSRTADIEKILIMGAHGPRRLIVVLQTG